VHRRRVIAVLGAAVCLLPAAWFGWVWATFPSDRTPAGAYLRVVIAVNRGKPEQFFAYLETRAQHACYTRRDYRRHARDRVLAAYPEPERTRLAREYEAEAAAPDGSDLFAIQARQRGWLDVLRRDMTGIRQVEIDGERASVETSRGTRYPFRRRDNGIWGLTLFTATLEAEAEKSARDAALIDQAATDYERARRAGP
jgi:hypothetical protein